MKIKSYSAPVFEVRGNHFGLRNWFLLRMLLCSECNEIIKNLIILGSTEPGKDWEL